MLHIRDVDFASSLSCFDYRFSEMALFLLFTCLPSTAGKELYPQWRVMIQILHKSYSLGLNDFFFTGAVTFQWHQVKHLETFQE